MQKKINSIELFCGTGGLALGLQESGFSHKALYEWDKDSCDNIKANITDGFPGINDWKVYQSDVRTVHYDGYRGSIDIISGGPPCQPFSLGGQAQTVCQRQETYAKSCVD